MTRLTDTIKQYLTPHIVLSASKHLNESENGVSKALGSMTAALFAGIIIKSEQKSLMEQVFQQAIGFDGTVLDRLGVLVNSDNLTQHTPLEVSENLVTLVFGGKSPAVVNAVASFSGIKHSSASILSAALAGPLTLGILNKLIKQEPLTPAGMVLWIESQKGEILSKLPGSVAALIGLTTPPKHQNVAASVNLRNWFLSMLVLLALGLVMVWYMRGG
ncbi:MAG: DUF937 domain-containing protein [Saprospiraceae bacterium]|nr:DUF937 domain-containing protein [Saprospiraceae bacterium]